ncbi:MAG: HDOD domain-containing protein [Planctomycetota bacterium]
MQDEPRETSARSDERAPASDRRAEAVRLVLDRVDRLPTLSAVAAKLLGMGSADDADLDEIVKLIESDPSLSATMLALCRKADKGLGDRITTVRRAVVMLGLESVRSTVLGVEVYDLMRGVQAERAPEGAVGLDRGALWKHAAAVACAAELLAREPSSIKPPRDGVFVAGILHDLGKQVLDLVLPASYAKVLRLAEQERSDSAPIERRVIGLDNHTAGRRLAEKWKLPEAVRTVVWLHSQPPEGVPEGPHRDLVLVVTLARAWVRGLHLGACGDFGPIPDAAELASRLGFKPGVLDRLETRLIAEVAERWSLLGLDDQSEPELLLGALATARQRLASINRSLEDKLARTAGAVTLGESLEACLSGWEPGAGPAAALDRVLASVEALSGRRCGACALRRDDRWSITLHPGEPEPEPAELVLGELRISSETDTPWAIDPRATAEPTRLAPGVWTEPSPDAGAPGTHRLVAELPRAGVLVAWLDGPLGGERCERRWLEALLGVWNALLGAGALHERDRRASDALAETNRRIAEMQARLTEQQSMARLGEMTAGAAHEMNNPLTVIRGHAQLLADQLSDAGDRESARLIVESAATLSDLIGSMHLLAAPPAPNPLEASPAMVVRRAEAIARERAPGLRVQADLSRAPERVRADAEQLAAALAELLINAAEAAPNEIVSCTIETGPRDDRWSVRISDRGPGLSERARRHAFDPFFSERPAGRGRGLGLPRARRLIELAGGGLWIESSPGGGTLARAELPTNPLAQQAA